MNPGPSGVFRLHAFCQIQEERNGKRINKDVLYRWRKEPEKNSKRRQEENYTSDNNNSFLRVIHWSSDCVDDLEHQVAYHSNIE